MAKFASKISGGATELGNVSETPTPTTCPKSTAVHLQFVRQFAPHLYRRTFLASKLRRKGNPAIRLPFNCTAVRLPFVRQYAPHLYGSTVGKIPRGPKDQKNSRFRSRLKISIENEILERATHRGPIFCGEIETSRLKFRA